MKALNNIKNSCDKKFPNRTINNLPKKLYKDQFISYAYLSKNIVFTQPFNKLEYIFDFKGS